ncbi:MAG: hypothetical protein R2784_08065 [Saprospiraceae bacterium]
MFDMGVPVPSNQFTFEWSGPMGQFNPAQPDNPTMLTAGIYEY